MVRELQCPSLSNVYVKSVLYLTEKWYQFILHHLHIVKLVLKQDADLENLCKLHHVSPIQNIFKSVIYKENDLMCCFVRRCWRNIDWRRFKCLVRWPWSARHNGKLQHASNFLKLRSATAKHEVQWRITQGQKAQRQNSGKTNDEPVPAFSGKSLCYCALWFHVAFFLFLPEKVGTDWTTVDDPSR